MTRKVAAPTQQVASRAESPAWERCPREAGLGTPGTVHLARLSGLSARPREQGEMDSFLRQARHRADEKGT